MAKPNPALVSYIEKHLSKGVDIKRIKQKLSEVGHPIEAIEEAASFVTQQKPALKRKPKRFMIVYGIILILVLSAGGYFVWLKAMQQREYTQVVEQIETTKSYQGMTDVALLKLAASGDMNACKFIKDHNMYYACTGKYWERNDCTYESLIGEDVPACRARNKVGESFFRKYCSPFKGNDVCFLSIATGENDLKYCYDYAGCLVNFAIWSGKSEICGALSAEDKERCLLRVSLKNQDRSICDNMQDSLYCEVNFMSPQEKADRIKTTYSRLTVDGTLSDKEFQELLKDIVSMGSDDFCSQLEGNFKQFDLKDLCYFYYVESRFTNSLNPENNFVFDPTKHASSCASISGAFLKSCCDSVINERLIKSGCDIYEEVGA